MVMSAKADLTHVCWTLRPASSQILQQSASTEDQMQLTSRRDSCQTVPKDPNNKRTKRKRGGHLGTSEACLYDLVTTGHDHPRVDAEGRATRLRTPGHKVGNVGQPGE